MNTVVASGVQKQRQSTSKQDSARQQDASGKGNCKEDAVNSCNNTEALLKCSYRSLNELPSDAPIIPMVAEMFSDKGNASTTVPLSPFYNANSSRLLAFNPDGSIQFGSSQQGYQPFTMSTSGAPQAQYCFVPGNKVVVQGTTGDMSAYQIRSPTTSLPQGVAMAGSPGSLYSPQQLAEEASRKRELRLMKNREAARECRRKKKEYVKCLENRVAVLENQNKMLIEELKALKDLYSHKIE
ncbi:cAMP responsive element modulator b isoform X1 [Pygocentrus nattereri]|uniref:cAMP responsive element modulator b isoform X1 n=1 Tax=Pygocentrus nattereri TaxID=42514 RepID=UPI0018913C13|nr:cAMP responsive element modulator b isoform X1 [Pygocentrus nattereri]